jgi:hypothetical protein
MRKSDRIIEKLRKHYGGKWQYVGIGRWEGESVTVQAYSKLSPRYDGDDDTFATEYREVGTGKLVDFWPPFNWTTFEALTDAGQKDME